jgi:hypothetical protein
LSSFEPVCFSPADVLLLADYAKYAHLGNPGWGRLASA